MPRIARLIFRGDDEQEEANRQTASLAALAVVLFLVVVGLFLVRQLHAEAMLEDCLMAGLPNCDKMVSSPR